MSTASPKRCHQFSSIAAYPRPRSDSPVGKDTPMRPHTFRLGAVVLAAMLAAPASAAILVNGGFEEPDRGTGRNYHMIAPSNVPGWSTTDTVIEIWANGFNGVTISVSRELRRGYTRASSA